MKRADRVRQLIALGLCLTLFAGCASTDAAPEPDVAEDDSAPEGDVLDDDVSEDATTEDAETEAEAEDDEPAEVPSGDEPTQEDAAGDTGVAIDDFFFDPETTSVAVGDTVTWTHQGDITHNVTARDESFASDNLTGGETFSHTFDTAGSFEYRCTLHGQMVGTIEVS